MAMRSCLRCEGLFLYCVCASVCKGATAASSSDANDARSCKADRLEGYSAPMKQRASNGPAANRQDPFLEKESNGFEAVVQSGRRLEELAKQSETGLLFRGGFK